MNGHDPQELPSGVPDLGNVGKPQQVEVGVAMLLRGPSPIREAVGTDELLEMIRQVMREELQAMRASESEVEA